MLEKEFEYYVEHQDELVRKYNGKILVIKNKKVIGVFDNEIEAIHGKRIYYHSSNGAL